MDRKEILRLRLYNQRLSSGQFATPAQVVAHFGAMQAQDHAMAQWAVGLRMRLPDRSQVLSAMESGEIIRTHVLRPTWHLVHRDDIRWMMSLTAPNVRKVTRFNDRKEGLTDELFGKVWRIMERAFVKDGELTKEDIVACLSQRKIEVGGLLATQIIIRAELEMRVCNGAKKGSYALFDVKVPPSDKVPREEALARLAKMYFTSRGPATWKDFAWWSGLSAGDAKEAMAASGMKLASNDLQGLTFHHVAPDGPIPSARVTALLPCFDEYTVGYAEGRDIIFPAGVDRARIGNGIFHPVIVAGNELAGTWRKVTKRPYVELNTFSDGGEARTKALNAWVERFNAFFMA